MCVSVRTHVELRGQPWLWILAFHSKFRYLVCCCGCQADWPMSLGAVSCLLPSLGGYHWDNRCTLECLALNGCRGSKFGSSHCETGALSSETSPEPWCGCFRQRCWLCSSYHIILLLSHPCFDIYDMFEKCFIVVSDRFALCQNFLEN